MSSIALDTPAPPPDRVAAAAVRGDPRVAWTAAGLVTLLAAGLRLWHLGGVRLDPYYDAAVQSMGHSLHDFLFGAYEPGGSLAIDKPPLDLWVEVLSVKLLGFTSFAIKLPEALGGTLAVPLLFAAVRRVWGDLPALIAALALAVLPIEVITARSDTSDSLMMLLIVLALYAIVRAGADGPQPRPTRWLVLAGVSLGLAFNVKLLQALIPLPALAPLAFLALPGTWRRRAGQIAAATLVLAVVSFCWLLATLLVPAHDRPYAIGSTDGTALDAAVVFNGTSRLSGTIQTTQGDEALRVPGQSYPTATQVERDAVPLAGPSPGRLLDDLGPLSGERLGWELLVGVLLGGPALALAAAGILRRGPPLSSFLRDGDALPAADRLAVAVAAGLLVWLVVGIVLFSAMTRLHPRYVESFVPAVAAAFGVGVSWAIALPARVRLVVLGVLLLALALYDERLAFGAASIFWLTLLGALGAVGLLAVPAVLPAPGSGPASVAPGRAPRRWGKHPLLLALPEDGLMVGALALTLLALLAVPLEATRLAIHERDSDAGNVGYMRPDEVAALGAYLRAHQEGARDEVIAAAATKAAALIVADQRPVLAMTADSRAVLTPIPQLRTLIAAGTVRYALIDSPCPPRGSVMLAGCSAPAQWVERYGTDVSRAAGVAHLGVLYLLPGAVP